MTMPISHLCYLTISVGLVLWVAWTLKRRGRVFWELWLDQEEEIASSWSHLVSVGFYLIHAGFVLLALRLGGQAENAAFAIEIVSTKVGLVLLGLALSHFLHIKVFWRMWKKSEANRQHQMGRRFSYPAVSPKSPASETTTKSKAAVYAELVEN